MLLQFECKVFYNYRYDVVYINLSQKPDWFLERSPLGKVPCIELDGGKTLYESLIIAEYLDDVYPQSKLFPSQPLTKAEDKLLIDKFNSVISTMFKVQLILTSNFNTNICMLQRYFHFSCTPTHP